MFGNKLIWIRLNSFYTHQKTIGIGSPTDLTYREVIGIRSPADHAYREMIGIWLPADYAYRKVIGNRSPSDHTHWEMVAKIVWNASRRRSPGVSPAAIPTYFPRSRAMSPRRIQHWRAMLGQWLANDLLLLGLFC